MFNDNSVINNSTLITIFKRRITNTIIFIIMMHFLIGCHSVDHNDTNARSNTNTNTIKQIKPLAHTQHSPLPISTLKTNFKNPEKHYYPETWFHLNGKNISKLGLTADLTAIKKAGLQGIQLFNTRSQPYPNVEQVPILTPKWEEMIGHIADETERLGLNLTLQNCPGWSMAGGPWVPVEESQRELIEHVFQLKGGQLVQKSLALKAEYLSSERNYQDIKTIAFKTLNNERPVKSIPNVAPVSYQTNNSIVPWDTVFEETKQVIYNPKKIHSQEPYRTYQQKNIQYVDGKPTWVAVTFAEKTTLRSLELPPIRTVLTNRLLPKVNIGILVEALQDNEQWQTLASLKVPTSHWYDNDYPVTFNLPETKAKTFKLTFTDDPLFLSYVRLNGHVRLHNHEAKASKSSRGLQSDIKQFVSTDDTINPNDIIDLTSYVNTQGQLNWQAPKGDWTVIRFGHVNMLKTNRPAEPEATGWETSKLDKIAIENHLRHGMMGNLMRDGGPLDGHKLHGMLIDSWESGVPTWTMHKDDLPKAFKQRRGYDMMPYLPATLGYIVSSVDDTNKFLRDLRQTMADLYVDNFFDHFRTVAHDMGAKVYTEGATGETLPGDPLRYYGVSDFPMTEFWYPKAPQNQKEAKPIYAAASAYHLYNKPFLAAEAATQLGVKWNESPKDIKYLINENFTKGVNHLVFHTFSHTPQVDVVPGSSFGGNIGFPFLRTQTWWRHTPKWIKSLARSQYLLQQGEFVADVLWYLGDDLDRHPFDTYPFPQGYKFDYLNEELLQEKVHIANGQLYVEDAGQYKIIMLRDSQRMLLSTAQKLKSLVEQGAVILGNKPQTSPSLMDDAQDLSKLTQIANQLWGDTNTGMRKVGKGKVYWGHTLQQVLNAEAIQPDVSFAKDLDLRWLHRSIGDTEVYYITNQLDKSVDASIRLRTTGTAPEIWNLDTGNTHIAPIWQQDDAHMNVAISLDPHGSQFIVINKKREDATSVTKSQQQGHIALKKGTSTLLSSQAHWFKIHDTDTPPLSFINGQLLPKQTGMYQWHSHNGDINEQFIQTETKPLNKPWLLDFEAGWETPSQLTLTNLIALNEHAEPAIQHYSGTITYNTSFTVKDKSQLMQLDLGQVADIAEVWLNHQRVGTRWAPPYTFDITKHVTDGENQLKVLVTNTWRNQLIYDAKRKASHKKTWTTNPPKEHETQLDLSGLIGPVSIQQINNNSVDGI
ncbi:glycosyl hydrolase [Catenovulum maritimum]|nr:glycosyl hydrolase [Catenovulum maritimum]